MLIFGVLSLEAENVQKFNIIHKMSNLCSLTSDFESNLECLIQGTEKESNENNWNEKE